MASLSECLSLLSIDPDDAAEIRALARENGGNVRAALQSMLADLNADRQSVLDRITETLGPAPAVPSRDSATTLEQAAQAVQRPTNDPRIMYQDAADIGAARNQLATAAADFDLSPDLASQINPIYQPEKLPPDRMKGSNREAAEFLESTYADEPITDLTAELPPARKDRIATQMAAETELALMNTTNAFNWYSAALDRTVDVVGVKYPVLIDEQAALDAGLGSTSNARFLFTYIMAVTSQNLDVAANARATDVAFERMLQRWSSGDYTMDTRRWGTGGKQKAMNDNFAKFNRMLPKMPGETAVERLAAMDRLFRRSQTVSEWVADMRAAGIPYSPPGQTAMDAVVYGSSTLGPKIGNGFWQNLNGNFTPLTIDLWMRRTWGRYTGKSIGLEDALPGQRERLRAAVKRSRSRRNNIDDYVAELDARVVGIEAELASMQRQDFGTQKAFNAHKRTLNADLKNLKEVRADAAGIKAPEAYDAAYNTDNAALLDYAKRLLKVWDGEYKRLVGEYGNGNVPDELQPTWARAAKTIRANLGSPLDQVANGTQRRQIEETGQLALQKLSARGINITMADMQALLWYPEKELWNSLTRKLDVDEDGVPIPIASNLNESYDTVFTRMLMEQGYEVEGSAGTGSGGSGGRAVSEQSGLAGERQQRADGDIDGAVGREGRGGEGSPAAAGVDAGGDARSGDTGAAAPGSRVLRQSGRGEGDASGVRGQAQPVDGAAFSEAMEAAGQALGPIAAQVSTVDPSRDVQRFLLDDGMTGYALEGDNLIGVFKHPDAPGGAAQRVMADAVARGARRLDGFNTMLPGIYAKGGFRAVARLPFDPQYAPARPDALADWDAEAMDAMGEGWGAPDVFFMVYDPESASAKTDNVVATYEDGMAAQDAALAEIGTDQQPTTLNQDQTGDDAPRGNIEIPAAGVESGTTVINLFDGADTSTVIHESGHYFYEVFSTLASDPNAPQQMKDDLAALQAWMGVEPGKTPSVAAQERMARGMERYVLEGKAPSIELARVFASFKQWMLNVYANVKRLIGNPQARQRYAERQLKINLTDDVREVFDRLLATDDMIAEAQDALNLRPMFSGEAMGDMDARTQETYQRLTRDRTERASQKLIDRAMAAVRRRKEAWWKAERKTRLAAEMDRLNGEQRYRALDALATGQMAAEDSEADPIAVPRIDRDALIEMFGKGVIDELGPRNFGMTRAVYTTAQNSDGMSPQEAADLFGYRDAQEMIDDIRQAGRREEIAEANVDQAMTEEYGDPFTDGSIEAEALEAVHSDNQADMVALELRHIARKRGQDTRRMQTRFFKARAAAIIGQLEVRQVMNPNRFLTAERRAAKAAERALAGVVRGDPAALAEAQQAKEQQLLNHYLYLEARDLERVISRKREEMRGYDNADRRKRIGSPHIEQIDAILDNYEFRQRSQAAVQRNLNLAAYLQKMEQEGRERELAAVDPRIVEQAQRVHYSRLSVDELRGVFNTVDNIAHVGRRTREVVTARRKRMLDESAARVADQVLANQKLKDDSRTGIAGRIWNSLSRVDTIAVRMDGGEEFGTFHNEIKREIDEAQAEEQRLGTEVMEKIGGLFETHYTREELRNMAKERSIPNAGLWTHEQAIMIALNTGTESNMQRVMDPRVPEKLRMTQQRLDAILSTLDERDWRFVQDTWNLIDGYWPQSAEVEQRRTGVKPKKIDARPMWQGAPSFVTGGYFRLYYDGDLSARAKADQDRGSMFEGMSQTRRGGAQVADKMMTGRQQTAGGMPVLYSFSSITRQLRQATRFIALSETVDGTARILNHPLVQDALRATGNLDVASTLDLWLKDIASGPIYDAHWVSSSARLVKNNFTISRLGFNLKTVLLQLTGLTQASVAIGHGNMARGLAAYGRNLTTIHNDIIAKSPFMQERMSTFQKDIYDFRNEIAMSSPVTTGYNKFMDTLARYSFEPMIRMQFHGVDVPTWLGAYEAALADGQSEQDAVYRADRMVARSQDSALMADRAALERGTVSDTIRQADLIRLFTTLGGYMMTKMNRANVEFLRRRMQIRQADSPAVRLGIAMKLAGDLMILYAAESAIMGLMYAMLSDEDEPEDLIRFIVSETASTAVGGIPFLRDSVGAFRGFEGGVYGSVTSAPARAWTQISQGEIDDSFWRSVLEVAGTATGMPSTQTYRIIDQFTGDDEGSWSEALIGSNPLTR